MWTGTKLDCSRHGHIVRSCYVSRLICHCSCLKYTVRVYLTNLSLCARLFACVCPCVCVCISVEHDWNPFVDLQAMDRVHRIGQSRPVTVYRLLGAYVCLSVCLYVCLSVCLSVRLYRYLFCLSITTTVRRGNPATPSSALLSI
jgi:hypothetical protein